jgi:hypothetical protein
MARSVVTGEYEPKRADYNMNEDELRDYYRRVQAVGTFLFGLCNSQADDGSELWMENRLSESVNPYYDQTEPGGLLLIFYYGMPSSFGTPLGQLPIGGSGSGHHEAIHPVIAGRLGASEIAPQVVNTMGVMGPWWAVTRDMEGREFPVVQRRKGRDYLGYEECKSLWKKVRPAGRM